MLDKLTGGICVIVYEDRERSRSSLKNPTINSNTDRDSHQAMVTAPEVPAIIAPLTCRGGGTGRRAGFKIRFLHGSVGSIPTLGTNT